MNIARKIVVMSLLAGMPLLGACGGNPKPAETAATKPEASIISRAVNEAVTEARQEIATGNITISDRVEGVAKAEITPKGDLLIDGKAVAIDAQQRALLLEHRGQIAAIANAGMEIGVQGAELATKAVAESLKGVFSGDEKAVEQRIEAEAAKIEASALKLCDQMPAMLASQQKLAAALPAFKPYATMTQEDVDDCGDEARQKVDVSRAPPPAPPAPQAPPKG